MPFGVAEDLTVRLWQLGLGRGVVPREGHEAVPLTLMAPGEVGRHQLFAKVSPEVVTGHGIHLF